MPQDGSREQTCDARKIQRLFSSTPTVKLISRFGTWASAEVLHREGPSLKTSEMHGPLSYIGGKNRLAKRVIEIFPKHTTYVEAFAGGAQVFFRKEPSEGGSAKRSRRRDRELLPRLPAAP